MAVESSNVEQLMGWLAEGSAVRSANPAAETLVVKLAALLFQGDADWPNHADRAEEYRDALQARLSGDGGNEARCVALTAPDADPATFIDWFLPVVLAWERQPATGADGPQLGGESVSGLPNPNCDGTPGTEFYRLDDAGQYLYSAGAEGADGWATYEQRRYSEPTRNDAYGLDHRYDRTQSVYEWYDEASGTWKDQAWADGFAADKSGSAAETPGESAAAAWDENWKMFYRLGSGGEYEFAEAVKPGDESSGCGGVWLGREKLRERAARAAVESALAAAPELAEFLDQQDIDSAVAALSRQTAGGQG